MIKSASRTTDDWAFEEGLKFSGHESFAIRYGWLPKLYDAVASDPDTFASDERAILTLGLGRNMVKSIRFWGDALGLIETKGRRVLPTPLATRLLDPEKGLDPYVEEHGTLWRLHWRLVAHARLGAWTSFFLDMRDAHIPRDRLVAAVSSRAEALGSRISPSTAASHVDILVRTYDAERMEGETVLEDALGCPLQELELMRAEQVLGTSTLRLARGPKPTLDAPAFAYALHDYWTGTASGSSAVSLRSLMLARRSPGMVFALDETTLYEQLDKISRTLPSLELRDDGAGGMDIVATRSSALSDLEALAW